jgi:hypothetical protein
MPQHRNFHQACRRFEMLVHDGVPESPQPMYQENTYGKTPSRHTGKASDAPGAATPDSIVAAVFVVQDGKMLAVSPFESEEEITSAS